jgi:Protein of unknown function (DUF3048) N-terminal domain/Protein of unknown function (DUF3048) C-terminal domain
MTASPAITVAPTISNLVPADLDGVLSDPAVAHRVPLAVSIDDAAVARPQAGFNAASIVIQAPADGYESRYLMIFQEADSADIGPVRSARIYLAQWAAELDAGFAHYGGDRLSLAWLKGSHAAGLTNIDGIGAGNPAYHRVSDRSAPHNAYTSSEALIRQAARLGGEATIDPAVHLRPFRDDGPASTRPASQKITIPYRTVRVDYAYDPLVNGYVRSLNGKVQVDPVDSAPVTARTVIVLSMAFRTDNTIEPGHNRPVLGFVGSGPATIFMEGVSVSGTWSKASETAPTLILGPDGAELPLVRGRIFIQVVPTGTKVTTGT